MSAANCENSTRLAAILFDPNNSGAEPDTLLQPRHKRAGQQVATTSYSVGVFRLDGVLIVSEHCQGRY